MCLGCCSCTDGSCSPLASLHLCLAPDTGRSRYTFSLPRPTLSFPCSPASLEGQYSKAWSPMALGTSPVLGRGASLFVHGGPLNGVFQAPGPSNYCIHHSWLHGGHISTMFLKEKRRERKGNIVVITVSPHSRDFEALGEIAYLNQSQWAAGTEQGDRARVEITASLGIDLSLPPASSLLSPGEVGVVLPQELTSPFNSVDGGGA